MKKLISILLVVALLAICLCSCEIVKFDDTKQPEDTTTAAPEEVTTAPKEETTTQKGPWSPNLGGDAGPIELPGVAIKPTVTE